MYVVRVNLAKNLKMVIVLYCEEIMESNEIGWFVWNITAIGKWK